MGRGGAGAEVFEAFPKCDLAERCFVTWIYPFGVWIGLIFSCG